LGKGVSTTDLTPTIGTEVTGVQISKLSLAGRDQLARFVAERKVVAFRDQDFADLPINEALDIGRYFGRLQYVKPLQRLLEYNFMTLTFTLWAKRGANWMDSIHPTSGAPAGYPEVHLVHRGVGDKTAETFFETRTSSVAWHSDVSYEKQPPGTTFLYILDVPSVGGDTLFANQVEAYNRLSDGFKERLHGLKATHSGIEQVTASKSKNGAVRREPMISVHPVVRTHPVTGEKALYVNPQCKWLETSSMARAHMMPVTRSIVGYKQEESDNLLVSGHEDRLNVAISN
jgi:sulfonate dioxygenase